MADFCYLSDEEFREDFSDAMNLDGSGDRLTDANRRKADKHHREAAAVIQAHLRACLGLAGLPEALVSHWLRGRDYERNIGLYFAYTRGSLGEAYDQNAIDRMRQDWLEPFLAAPTVETCWMCSEFCPGPTDPSTVDGPMSAGAGCVTGPCNSQPGRCCNGPSRPAGRIRSG